MKRVLKRVITMILLCAVLISQEEIYVYGIDIEDPRDGRYVDGTDMSGTVEMQMMTEGKYEGCGYYPANELLRVKWDGLFYRACLRGKENPFGPTPLTPTEAASGGDNYARLSKEVPFVSYLRTLYISPGSTIGKAESKTGNFILENIKAEDLIQYRYLMSFTIHEEDENGSVEWNMFGRSYYILPEPKIDMDAPAAEILLSQQNEGNGYCQNVTATVSAKDEKAGLSSTPFSWDQGATWSAEAARSFSKNGTYSVWIKDKIGNTVKKEFAVTTIDQEVPNIKTIIQTPSKQKNGYTKSMLLTIDAADYQRGLSETPYSWDGGKTWTSEKDKTVTENRTYSVTVRDLLGNAANAECYVKTIDRESPRVVSVNRVIPNGYSGYGKSVLVELESEDTKSGLDEMPYSWDGGANWTSDGKKIFAENGESYVFIRDKLENETKEKVVVSCIDKEAPMIHSAVVSSLNAVNGYVKNAIIEVCAEDTKAGLAKTPYSYDGGVSWESESAKEITDNEKVYIKVRDGLQNQSDTIVSVDCIDREGPVIEEVLTELPEENLKYGKNVMVHIKASDKKSGLGASSYSYDNGQTWVSSNKQNISQNAAIYVAVRDGLGNVTRKTVLVNQIDTEPPKVSITGNPKSTVKSDVTLTITASDEQSGIASIWYQNDTVKSRTLLGNYAGGSYVKEKVSIATNGIYRFFVYDKTGNVEQAAVNVTKIKKGNNWDERKKSSSSSSKRTSSSSSKDDSVTDHPIVTTIVERHDHSTTKKSIVITEGETKKVSDNRVEKSEKTKIIRQKSGSSSVNKDWQEDEQELQTSQEEFDTIEVIEGDLTENLAEAPAVGKTEIQYPEKKKDGVSTQKIVLVSLGIGLFLLVVVFLIFYKMGILHKGEEEKDSE